MHGQEHPLRVFTINTGGSFLSDSSALLELVRLTDEYGFFGVLLFTGHDTVVDSWLAAQYVISHSRRLVPLIAVNPAYLHPFAAAKMLSSLVVLYKRAAFINLVAGTSKSNLEAIGDGANHDERYLRLAEFTQILKALTQSPRPYSFAGSYYKVSGLQLLPLITADLRPEFFLAGASNVAKKICKEQNVVGLQMLPNELAELAPGTKAVNFGIIARESRALAAQAAALRFPDLEENRAIFHETLKHTDAVWKRRTAQITAEFLSPDNGYWLGPFANLQSDSPFFVGSYDETARLISALSKANVRNIILDIPVESQEFEHVCTAFERAGFSYR
jgi:alkanesulfonate monooxygenase